MAVTQKVQETYSEYIEAGQSLVDSRSKVVVEREMKELGSSYNEKR